MAGEWPGAGRPASSDKSAPDHLPAIHRPVPGYSPSSGRPFTGYPVVAVFFKTAHISGIFEITQLIFGANFNDYQRPRPLIVARFLLSFLIF